VVTTVGVNPASKSRITEPTLFVGVDIVEELFSVQLELLTNIGVVSLSVEDFGQNFQQALEPGHLQGLLGFEGSLELATLGGRGNRSNGFLELCEGDLTTGVLVHVRDQVNQARSVKAVLLHDVTNLLSSDNAVFVGINCSESFFNREALVAEEQLLCSLNGMLGFKHGLEETEEHVVLNATCLFFFSSLGLGCFEFLLLLLEFGLVFDLTLFTFFFSLCDLRLHIGFTLGAGSLTLSQALLALFFSEGFLFLVLSLTIIEGSLSFSLLLGISVSNSFPLVFDQFLNLGSVCSSSLLGGLSLLKFFG